MNDNVTNNQSNAEEVQEQQQEQGQQQGQAQQQQPGKAAEFSFSLSDLSEENQAIFQARGWKPGETKADAFFDTVRNLEKFTGVPEDQIIRVPTDPANPHEWDGFDKLGVPKEGEGEKYQITKPELAEGMDWDENFENHVREDAAKLRIADWQMQGLVESYAKYFSNLHTENMKAFEIDNQQMETSLRAEWGKNYDANKEIAQIAARVGGLNDVDSEEDRQLMAQVLGSERLVKIFHKFGEMLTEDQLKEFGQGLKSFGTTPVAAKNEVDQLYTDQKFMDAYTNKNNPGHEKAVKKMTELQKIAAGD